MGIQTVCIQQCRSGLHSPNAPKLITHCELRIVWLLSKFPLLILQQFFSDPQSNNNISSSCNCLQTGSHHWCWQVTTVSVSKVKVSIFLQLLSFKCLTISQQKQRCAQMTSQKLNPPCDSETYHSMGYFSENDICNNSALKLFSAMPSD